MSRSRREKDYNVNYQASKELHTSAVAMRKYAYS